MVKRTQTIRRQKLINCLSVFGHFVELVLKGLRWRCDFDNKRVTKNYFFSGRLSDKFVTVKIQAAIEPKHDSKEAKRDFQRVARDGSRTAATSKMELEAVNYYHKALHLGCCSSPISASGSSLIIFQESQKV